jgi:hypothetical protein
MLKKLTKTLKNKHTLLIISLLLLTIMLYNIGRKALSKNHQHDFVLYYYGTVVDSQGNNPYLSENLSKVAGKQLQKHLHYSYPPLTLLLFKPLTHLPFDTARQVFLFIKIAMIILLITLWYKYLLPDKRYFLLLTLLIIGAFHSTVSSDLLSGNISTLEQLLLWTGFICLLKKKPYWGAGFIVATACLKLTPLIFLLILFIPKDKDYKKAAIYGGIAFIFIQGISFIFQPELYQAFLSAPNALDSSGYVNPSSLAFFTFKFLPRFGLGHITNLNWIIYAAWVCSVGGVFVWKWRTKYRHYPLLQQISIICLYYAIIMPRFKDYTFIMLIIPALITLSAINSKTVKTIMFILLMVSLWPYHHLGMAGALLLFQKPILFRKRINNNASDQTP